MDYAEWIAENVAETYGRCAEMTLAMVTQFPELRRVRGHYHCRFWGAREHWWCVAPDGKIIDPTAAQFPSKGHGEYIEHIEGSPEPTGKCPDCGGYTYKGNTFCSPECEESTMTDLGFVKIGPGKWAQGKKLTCSEGK